MPYARQDIITWTSGQYYHIYNRGAKKSVLFHEPDNYQYVIRKAGYYCDKYHLSLIAYCLMPNHYHFLVRQDGEHPAGKLPQYIFNGYTKAYNQRYGTSGTLFERRYQVKNIASYPYLLHLCRYIHSNPVKDGIVTQSEEWLYSNYLEWIEMCHGRLVDYAFIREYFDTKDAYKAFVEYIQTLTLPEDVESYLSALEG